jgi:hypothetical protein
MPFVVHLGFSLLCFCIVCVFVWFVACFLREVVVGAFRISEKISSTSGFPVPCSDVLHLSRAGVRVFLCLGVRRSALCPWFPCFSCGFLLHRPTLVVGFGCLFLVCTCGESGACFDPLRCFQHIDMSRACSLMRFLLLSSRE